MKKILFFVIFFILQACGTKGSIYLPEKKYPIDGNEQEASQDNSTVDIYESSGTVDE